MNLPNALTVSRIVFAPAVALLPFVDSWPLRFLAFALFITVAVTDYWDGKLARSRNLVTTLGTLLDPLADKLLLLATFIPMFLLVGNGSDASLLSPHRTPYVEGVVGALRGPSGEAVFPFVTPFGPLGLPWWILGIVLGRELFMTIFRQAASRRGIVIAAIGPAKLKTALQWTWAGTAFFWFGAATLAADQQWTSTAWRALAHFNGIAGTVTMTAAVLLTLYSMGLYLHRYGALLTRQPAR